MLPRKLWKETVLLCSAPPCLSLLCCMLLVLQVYKTTTLVQHAFVQRANVACHQPGNRAAKQPGSRSAIQIDSQADCKTERQAEPTKWSTMLQSIKVSDTICILNKKSKQYLCQNEYRMPFLCQLKWDLKFLLLLPSYRYHWIAELLSESVCVYDNSNCNLLHTAKEWDRDSLDWVAGVWAGLANRKVSARTLLQQLIDFSLAG